MTPSFHQGGQTGRGKMAQLKIKHYLYKCYFSKPSTYCKKCNITLCMNCFALYHKNYIICHIYIYVTFSLPHQTTNLCHSYARNCLFHGIYKYKSILLLYSEFKKVHYRLKQKKKTLASHNIS